MNIHLKFPFAVVGGVLVIPTYEETGTKAAKEAEKQEFIAEEQGGETAVPNALEPDDVQAQPEQPAASSRKSTLHLVDRLVRAGGRRSEAVAHHLLEGIAVIVYNPDTGTIHPDLPNPGSGLRWQEFVEAMITSYRSRFEDQSQPVILIHMRFPGHSITALFLTALTLPAFTAPVPPCTAGARSFLPCELTFDLKTPDGTPYTNDLLRVEFRSPTHKTYLLHAYADSALHVRFSPTEPGTWAYHVLSDIVRYNDQESTFPVADSGLPGMVNVANIRHWRTTDKKPHLWLAAAAPFLTLSQPEWEAWLDSRKHDGFTHIRGPLLTASASAKPFNVGGQPNPAYFETLDDRLLAAAQRGFILDLLLADQSFLQTGLLANFDAHEPVIRYLAARYGGLNITWQGIEHFEDTPDSRALLKDLGSLLDKYDGFHHPRSTDARDSSFPLLADGWMNYLIEASPNPQLGAVEHQFTEQPEIHIIHATEPAAFRHELWNSTANGEYPSVSYESLRNEANVKAVQIWQRILAGTRHWEFEPYFDVDGARTAGLNEVEYLAYAQTPGIVEITLPRHKYNPLWINPATGEEIDLKNYKGEVFSRPTPDNAHDWILQVPREGQKESMLKYFYFESQDPPLQEAETDPSKTPFEVIDPQSDSLNPAIPIPFSIKITKANRASRSMQYAWWGEVVASGAGARLLGLGPSGTFTVPQELLKVPGETLHVRVLAINANGKAYELDRVYRLPQ